MSKKAVKAETATETAAVVAEETQETAATEAETETVQPQEAEAEEKQEAKTAANNARVWCGPTIRHVAKQFTVYNGELPEALAEFLKAKPAAGGLLVSLDKFPQTRIKIGQPLTAESILYKIIKSQI